MSWRDRDEGEHDGRGLGRPGGDWQGMRPSFDNPFTWSLPLFRAGGIHVRMHLFFLIFVIVTVLRSNLPEKGAAPTPMDARLTAIAMAGLFILVLAHEFGHCLACRRSGGVANEILMWPLGGLAFCQPPNHWRAHLSTAIGGPLVNVAFLAVIGPMLGALTGIWIGVALPNPLSFDGLNELAVSQSLAMQSLYLLNTINLMLLLFNLLPIFPLDGGRIVQSLSWPRLGYSRSMIVAVRIGYIGALLLGLFGAVISQWMLVGVAIFCGITCYITQKQLQWTNEMLGFESDEYAISAFTGTEPQEDPAPVAVRREERQARRRAEREADEAREVDRVLQKIAKSGMASLNQSERAVLERETERKRQNR